MSDLPYRYYPIPRQDRRRVELDYIRSDDLATIEDGIRDTMRGVDVSQLVLALAFAKIDREALYIQAGCKSYLEYLDGAEDRLNMSRQSMSDYKRIGEIYIEYKTQLQEAGFKEEGHLHKLRYLPRALEHHPKKEVFNRLVRDSFRRFVSYALPEGSRISETQQQYAPQIQVSEGRIIVDGKNILHFDPELPETARDELTEYLTHIYEVRATGNKPYILNVYDDQEALAVERFLARRRARK